MARDIRETQRTGHLRRSLPSAIGPPISSGRVSLRDNNQSINQSIRTADSPEACPHARPSRDQRLHRLLSGRPWKHDARALAPPESPGTYPVGRWRVGSPSAVEDARRASRCGRERHRAPDRPSCRQPRPDRSSARDQRLRVTAGERRSSIARRLRPGVRDESELTPVTICPACSRVSADAKDRYLARAVVCLPVLRCRVRIGWVGQRRRPRGAFGRRGRCEGNVFD
jgi:hypothetical protein